MSDRPPKRHPGLRPDVRNVYSIDLPLADADHVLVERTMAGTYRVVGCVDHARQGHYKPPQFGALDEALAASESWAIEHGVRVIYVYDALPSPLKAETLNASEVRFRAGLGNL